MLTREQIGNNIYVVYHLPEQQCQLDNVSIMMINNNQSSNIGLASIRVDGKNGIYSRMMFDVTGKITLREYVSKNISQNDFKQMLTNLINALENFDEVMIDSKQVILDLDSVFINVLDHSIAFLCVALKEQSQSGSLYTFFKEIVENSYVTAGFNEASYFNRVYNVLHTENGFSIQNLRAAMNENASAPAPAKPAVQQQVQQGGRPAQSARTEEPETVTVSSGPVQKPVAPIQPSEQEAKKKGLFGGLFSSSKKKKTAPPASGYQGGLAGLVNAPKSPTSAAPVSAPSAPSAPAKPPMPVQQTSQAPAQSSGQLDFGGTTVLSGGMANAPKSPAQVAAAPAAVPSSASASQSIGTTVLERPAPAEQNGFVGTTVLNQGVQPSPGTTVLNPPSEKKGAIIRLRTRERFFISKSPFMIGRDTPGTDCDIHDNTNVGHRHASIVQRGNEFFVIDQHSTNHTFLNGSLITSGVETKLSEGDRLKFADEEFDFRIT